MCPHPHVRFHISLSPQPSQLSQPSQPSHITTMPDRTQPYVYLAPTQDLHRYTEFLRVKESEDEFDEFWARNAYQYFTPDGPTIPIVCRWTNCVEEFRDAQEMEHHIDAVHMSVCRHPECGKTFSDNSHLEDHIAQDHSVIPCNWADCEIAVEPSRLYEHITAHFHSVPRKGEGRQHKECSWGSCDAFIHKQGRPQHILMHCRQAVAEAELTQSFLKPGLAASSYVSPRSRPSGPTN